VLVVMRQSPRAFVERVGFRTSLGDRVTTVITDIGVLDRDPDRAELVLTALHPGASVDDARAATGWDLVTAPEVASTAPPTGDELAVLRELEAPRGRAA
jgi:glutaconate CoA-transferase subunit B